MGNIIFSTSMLIMTVQFFFISYRLTGINRVMLNIPISIFESSIPLVQERDEPIIYFDKEKLNTELTSYFEKSIKKYTDEYELDYYYYSQDDHSICTSEYCTAIEITIEAKITLTMNYQKTVHFYIQKIKTWIPQNSLTLS